MTPKDVIQYFGGSAAAARALKLTRATVSYWDTHNEIPLRTQALIELQTRGRLKADKSLIKKVKPIQISPPLD